MTDYKKTLERARRELAQLLKQREELDQRLLKLQKSIEGLAALCGEEDHSLQSLPDDLRDPDGQGSITESILIFLQSNIVPAKVPEIRDALKEEGFDPEKYSNFLTVIHNTLHRLARQGQVMKVRLPGQGFWGWTTRSTKAS
jgi:chromosome segregation ATPase